MKKIYTHENIFIVHNIKNIIEAQGIEIFMKNEFAPGVIGEISAFDAWPEIWILHDNDEEKTKAIIASATQVKNTIDWLCKHCNETNDPSFDICWQCQQARD
ncbi:hypothetical protein VST7929_02758 [Vibrio stylophorae]|uniref:RanBP2-type domain-containing protein n=1 Tax=Vibrio stylophorae TaxID=659351 RepID=A0ABN8DUU4_9VIBR|nr:DUF2007 domain-containing protein [Vibrio stylophorae]CAH0535097.1 hypothetical protein VST7929_02758 [Vibrio stylophorae]